MGTLFIETRILIAYGLIALLIAGAIITALYLRYNSREAVERRKRKKIRDLLRMRDKKEAERFNTHPM